MGFKDLSAIIADIEKLGHYLHRIGISENVSIPRDDRRYLTQDGCNIGKFQVLKNEDDLRDKIIQQLSKGAEVDVPVTAQAVQLVFSNNPEAFFVSAVIVLGMNTGYVWYHPQACASEVLKVFKNYGIPVSEGNWGSLDTYDRKSETPIPRT